MRHWAMLAVIIISCLASLSSAGSQSSLQTASSLPVETPRPEWQGTTHVWSDIALNVLAVCAIIIGGIWTWMVFVRTRQRFPRVDFSCRISDFEVDEARTLLRVTLVIENKGTVLLSLNQARVWLHMLKPWDFEVVENVSMLPAKICAKEAPSAEGEWPLVGERDLLFKKGQKEIEPGETDELNFDFVLRGAPEVLLVYAYLSNWKKKTGLRPREIGWESTAIHTLKEVKDGQEGRPTGEAGCAEEEASIN